MDVYAEALRRVREALEASGLSAREVARRSGGRVSHMSVARLARGSSPDWKTILAVASALGMALPTEENLPVAAEHAPTYSRSSPRGVLEAAQKAGDLDLAEALLERLATLTKSERRAVFKFLRL